MSRPEGGVKQKICMLFFLEKKKVIIELNCGEKNRDLYKHPDVTIYGRRIIINTQNGPS